MAYDWEKWRFARTAGLNRTIILYAVVTGMYWGWVTISWLYGGLAPARGMDTFAATEPAGTK